METRPYLKILCKNLMSRWELFKEGATKKDIIRQAKNSGNSAQRQKIFIKRSMRVCIVLDVKCSMLLTNLMLWGSVLNIREENLTWFRRKIIFFVFQNTKIN